MSRPLQKILFLCLLLPANRLAAQNNIVVMQSHFGVKDGAVSAMKGVAIGGKQ